MNPTIALLIAHSIAGLHSALIVFFFIGWLIPFTSFMKRCFANLAVGGAFLVFWLIGWCPLTVWENIFKAQAGTSSNKFFIVQQLSLFGVSLDTTTLNSVSLYLIVGVLMIASFYPFMILLKASRRRWHQKTTSGVDRNRVNIINY